MCSASLRVMGLGAQEAIHGRSAEVSWSSKAFRGDHPFSFFQTVATRDSLEVEMKTKPNVKKWMVLLLMGGLGLAWPPFGRDLLGVIWPPPHGPSVPPHNSSAFMPQTTGANTPSAGTPGTATPGTASESMPETTGANTPSAGTPGTTTPGTASASMSETTGANTPSQSADPTPPSFH
jgi:hypothetical protein